MISNGENQVYWDIQLDQDLLETIKNIYPEWFKESATKAMSEENPALLPFSQSIEAGSPPKSEVDDASIKNSMDKNKESLKVKLMLRRPINQLIEQGILPPLRTSPGFYEQRQKLERAKTGDFLKHKIQRRPQRQELIQQHILEDTTVDPSLHEKQRQLKKARLADNLNDRLSHRPGPLELIKGNILHTDEPFEQAVKEGQIHFKKTSEGEVIKHPPPRFVFEEESSSDSASPSQLTSSADQSLSSLISFDGSNDVSSVTPVHASKTVVTTGGSPTSLSYIVSSPVTSILTSPPAVHSILLGNGSTVAIAAPTSASAVVAVTSANTTPIITGSPFGQTPNLVSANSQSISTLKDHSSIAKCRKKAKSKAQPKTRTIKFHEYKGPPNAKNQSNSNQQNGESSYELLLQQQQLFLQWQLEWQQKYPQIILPAAQKSSADQEQGTGGQCPPLSQSASQSHSALKTSFQAKPINQNATNDNSNSIASSNMANNNNNMQSSQSKFNNSVVSKFISKLEDMKVSDLKAELKKRNLPVSGAKQQLIDRLKPFTESVMASAIANNSCLAVNAINANISNGLANLDSNETKSNASNATSMNNVDTCNSPSVTPKSESITELIPVSPTIVMDSPPMCDNSEVSRDKQTDSISPESILMEVENASVGNVDDDNCAMELTNDSPSNLCSTPINDDIVLLQQQRIAELQRELHKSQMQLQMQGSVIPIESQTVTIPITSAPQFHIVSASSPNTLIASVESSTPKTMQRQLLQHQLQQKLQQNMNCRSQQINNEVNIANLLANGSVAPSVKASLAAFLQNQQQQQTLTTKLLNSQNVSGFQQLVLCPTLCATSEAVNDNSPVNTRNIEISKQRTNSLPNSLSQRLLTQRTSSLPNFSTLITPSNATQLPTEQPNQCKSQFSASKPPPNYDEATKQISKNRDKKKSIKSQAVDDVLEILIKNGELPPSAAQDPTTPTTPEKNLSLKSNPVLPNLFNASASGPTFSVSKQNNTNDDNNNNGDNVNNRTSIQNTVTPSATLDFDFILDLEGLAEAMDINIAINDKSLQQNDKLNNNESNTNILNAINMNNNNNCNSTKLNSNNDISLSEFMDFQECALNVEDANWLELATTSAPSSEINMNYQNDGEHSSQSNCINSINNQKCSPNISISKLEASKHDPILPNTMFGGNLVDPLGDLFFDDSDFKTSIDLGTLMWDKVDFAT